MPYAQGMENSVPEYLLQGRVYTPLHLVWKRRSFMYQDMITLISLKLEGSLGSTLSRKKTLRRK